jgi:hypothetical protein
VKSVADFFTSHYSNPTTITINVGYGEVAGYNIGKTALGESITNYITASDYTTLASKFNATSVHDDPALGRAVLPDTDPAKPVGYRRAGCAAERAAIRLLRIERQQPSCRNERCTAHPAHERPERYRKAMHRGRMSRASPARCHAKSQLCTSDRPSEAYAPVPIVSPTERPAKGVVLGGA